MGPVRKFITPRKLAVAALAAAFALPFTQSAGAAQGAISGITEAPGFTLSVVHQFPAAPDGTLYGTTYYGGSHEYGNAYRLS
jgi:hypothetical protein